MSSKSNEPEGSYERADLVPAGNGIDPRNPSPILRCVLVGLVWMVPGTMGALILSLACLGESARLMALGGAVAGFVCGFILERC